MITETTTQFPPFPEEEKIYFLDSIHKCILKIMLASIQSCRVYNLTVNSSINVKWKSTKQEHERIIGHYYMIKITITFCGVSNLASITADHPNSSFSERRGIFKNRETENHPISYFHTFHHQNLLKFRLNFLRGQMSYIFHDI